MNAAFQAFITAMVNDDGSGETGDLMTKTWWTDLMELIDSQIEVTGEVITTNTTYYVATTGSDATGDGSVTTPWATPSYALSVLQNYRVQSGKTLTIQCDDGTYTLTSVTTNLGERFVLSGKNTYTKTVASIQSTSGSAGAYSIVFNVDDVTNVTTSDYVIVSNASGGTTPKYAEGCFDITAVDAVNKRITCASPNLVGVPAGAVAATMTVFKTNFFYTGTAGFQYAQGTVQNLVIRGDGTANKYAVGLSQGMTLSNVGILGFPYGISLTSAGVLSLENVAISGATIGIRMTNGTTINCLGSSFGLLVSGCTTGLSCADNSTLTCITQTVITGNGRGINCTRRASITLTPGVTIYESDAVYAERLGYVYLVGASITGTVSPTVNTLGNENGYIDT